MKKISLLPFLFVLLFLPARQSNAQGEVETPADSMKTPEEHRFGFMDINAYFDSRDWSTLTINYLALINPRLAYFSFINFEQGSLEPEQLDDISAFYSEHNLTYTPFKKIPIDLNVQVALSSGPKTSKMRLAPSWRVHDTPIIGKFLKAINLSYGINFHVVQLGYDAPLSDFTWQMEHFYRLDVAPTVLDNRIYISGFADHTIGGPLSKGVVTEHQLGVRLVDAFYLVGEYRYFSYLPDKFKNGIGMGLEYVILFK